MDTLSLNHVRDIAVNDFMDICGKLSGEKLFLFDETLHGIFSVLQIPNIPGKVMKLTFGTFTLPEKLNHVIYFVRPNLMWMKCLAQQIKYWKTKFSPTNIPQFHIYMSPRVTLMCEKMLEELEISIKCQEFHLDLIPFETDVLSMEVPAWRDCFLHGDSTCVSFVAKSIMKLQNLFGLIPSIKAKGQHSVMIADQLQRMRKTVGNYMDGNSQIETLILLDRSVDLYTPLLIQLTYEGLIDELYGIDNTVIQGKFQRVLNSSDLVFTEIRDYNQIYIGQKLKNKASQIEKEMEERRNLNTNSSVQQIKDFTRKVNRLKEDKKNLEYHINLLQDITGIIGRKGFKKAVMTQQSMLVGEDFQGCLDYIEECINKQDSITKVLRLLCLLSLTSGLSTKQYEFFKREIIQSYGYETLLTLQNLEKIGLLSNKSSYWSKIKSGFDLVHEDMDISKTMNELHSIYSGYCPLSVKIIDMALKGTWKQNKSLLDYLPGPIKEESQSVLKVDMTHSTNSKITLVYFIGGVTMSEINALRMLSKQGGGREFLIASTGLINGDKFVESCYEKPKPVGNVVEEQDDFVKIDKKEIPYK